jgi:hypothetical protein
MISNKQRTIALSTITIAALIVLFASGPLSAAHQAQAFEGGFGFHRGLGWGGWFGWGVGGVGGCGGWGGCSCGGCGGCCSG